jgi:hypothetical protein
MSKHKQTVEKALAPVDTAIAALDARRATGGMGIGEYESEVARIRFEATQPKPVVLPKADPDYVPTGEQPQAVTVPESEPLPGE